MNAKKAKKLRYAARCLAANLGLETPEGMPVAAYQWIRRPDGSVVRQLKWSCTRAMYQFSKGKGGNRVQAR